MASEFRLRARTVWAVMGHVVIAVALIAFARWLLVTSAIVIVMLLMAILLAFVLDPLVFLISRWMQRWLAIALVYAAIFGILAILGSLIVPALINQGKDFAAHLPFLKDDIESRLKPWIEWYHTQVKITPDIQRVLNATLDQLNTGSRVAVESLVTGALTVLQWTARGFLSLVMSIYVLLDKDLYVNWFHRVLSAPSRARLQGLLTDVLDVLGGYFRGLVVMVVFVSVTVSVLLWACHIKYWLFIGAVAGTLEVIPYFGAVAGAIPAVILGFYSSPIMGMGLIFAFIAINQVEGHVVAPLVMGHSMKLRPLAVLLALMVGEAVAKAPGMIIAVPVVGILRVIWIHGRGYFEMSDRVEDPPKNEV